MFNLQKKLFIFLLLISLFSISITTLASDTEISSYTIYEDTDTESAITIYPRLRGTYLLEGYASIGQASSGYVTFSGSTAARIEVPYISVSVSLQQFVGGAWYTLDTFYEIEYNDYYVSISKIAYVGSGSYFRIYTYHNANGETVSGYSNSIKIT